LISPVIPTPVIPSEARELLLANKQILHFVQDDNTPFRMTTTNRSGAWSS
jgi:hypothetical protein